MILQAGSSSCDPSLKMEKNQRSLHYLHTKKEMISCSIAICHVTVVGLIESNNEVRVRHEPQRWSRGPMN